MEWQEGDEENVWYSEIRHVGIVCIHRLGEKFHCQIREKTYPLVGCKSLENAKARVVNAVIDNIKELIAQLTETKWELRAANPLFTE